jgi:hypothetical protein
MVGERGVLPRKTVGEPGSPVVAFNDSDPSLTVDGHGLVEREL